MSDIRWSFATIVIVLVAIAGFMLVGYYLYPHFNKPEELNLVAVPDSTSMSGEPDTVWTETIVEKVISRVVTERDTITNEVVKTDTIYKFVENETDVGFKHFVHGPYVSSYVWAYALGPVTGMKNDVVVGWDEYVKERIEPQFQVTLKEKRKNELMKGIIMGAVVAASVATQDPWVVGIGGVTAFSIAWAF